MNLDNDIQLLEKNDDIQSKILVVKSNKNLSKIEILHENGVSMQSIIIPANVSNSQLQDETDDSIHLETIPHANGSIHSKVFLYNSDVRTSSETSSSEVDGSVQLEELSKKDSSFQSEISPKNGGNGQSEISPKKDGCVPSKILPKKDGCSLSKHFPETDGSVQSVILCQTNGSSLSTYFPETFDTAQVQVLPKKDGSAQSIIHKTNGSSPSKHLSGAKGNDQLELLAETGNSVPSEALPHADEKIPSEVFSPKIDDTTPSETFLSEVDFNGQSEVFFKKDGSAQSISLPETDSNAQLETRLRRIGSSDLIQSISGNKLQEICSGIVIPISLEGSDLQLTTDENKIVHSKFNRKYKISLKEMFDKDLCDYLDLKSNKSSDLNSNLYINKKKLLYHKCPPIIISTNAGLNIDIKPTLSKFDFAEEFPVDKFNEIDILLYNHFTKHQISENEILQSQDEFKRNIGKIEDSYNPMTDLPMYWDELVTDEDRVIITQRRIKCFSVNQNNIDGKEHFSENQDDKRSEESDTKDLFNSFRMKEHDCNKQGVLSDSCAKPAAIPSTSRTESDMDMSMSEEDEPVFLENQDDRRSEESDTKDLFNLFRMKEHDCNKQEVLSDLCTKPAAIPSTYRRESDMDMSTSEEDEPVDLTFEKFLKKSECQNLETRLKIKINELRELNKCIAQELHSKQSLSFKDKTEEKLCSPQNEFPDSFESTIKSPECKGNIQEDLNLKNRELKGKQVTCSAQEFKNSNAENFGDEIHFSVFNSIPWSLESVDKDSKHLTDKPQKPKTLQSGDDYLEGKWNNSDEIFYQSVTKGELTEDDLSVKGDLSKQSIKNLMCAPVACNGLHNEDNTLTLGMRVIKCVLENQANTCKEEKSDNEKLSGASKAMISGKLRIIKVPANSPPMRKYKLFSNQNNVNLNVKDMPSTFKPVYGTRKHNPDMNDKLSESVQKLDDQLISEKASEGDSNKTNHPEYNTIKSPVSNPCNQKTEVELGISKQNISNVKLKTDESNRNSKENEKVKCMASLPKKGNYSKRDKHKMKSIEVSVKTLDCNLPSTKLESSKETKKNSYKTSTSEADSDSEKCNRKKKNVISDLVQEMDSNLPSTEDYSEYNSRKSKMILSTLEIENDTKEYYQKEHNKLPASTQKTDNLPSIED